MSYAGYGRSSKQDFMVHNDDYFSGSNYNSSIQEET